MPRTCRVTSASDIVKRHSRISKVATTKPNHWRRYGVPPRPETWRITQDGLQSMWSTGPRDFSPSSPSLTTLQEPRDKLYYNGLKSLVSQKGSTMIWVKSLKAVLRSLEIKKPSCLAPGHWSHRHKGQSLGRKDLQRDPLTDLDGGGMQQLGGMA